MLVCLIQCARTAALGSGDAGAPRQVHPAPVILKEGGDSLPIRAPAELDWLRERGGVMDRQCKLVE